MRVLGVDPGANTGLVCLDLAPSLHWNDATWRWSDTITATSRVGLTHAENDALRVWRIRQLLDGQGVGLVVLEEPLDATTKWAGGQGRRSSTTFRLGAYYGLALASIHAAEPNAAIMSYPVTNHLGRTGWMQHRQSRASKHETTLHNVLQVARTIRGFPMQQPLSDHEAMALGVVMFHVGQVLTDRLAAKIATRAA